MEYIKNSMAYATISEVLCTAGVAQQGQVKSQDPNYMYTLYVYMYDTFILI